MGRGTAQEFDNCDQLPDGTVPDAGNGGGNGGNGGFQRSSTPSDEPNRYLTYFYLLRKSLVLESPHFLCFFGGNFCGQGCDQVTDFVTQLANTRRRFLRDVTYIQIFLKQFFSRGSLSDDNNKRGSGVVAALMRDRYRPRPVRRRTRKRKQRKRP